MVVVMMMIGFKVCSTIATQHTNFCWRKVSDQYPTTTTLLHWPMCSDWSVFDVLVDVVVVLHKQQEWNNRTSIVVDGCVNGWRRTSSPPTTHAPLRNSSNWLVNLSSFVQQVLLLFLLDQECCKQANWNGICKCLCCCCWCKEASQEQSARYLVNQWVNDEVSLEAYENQKTVHWVWWKYFILDYNSVQVPK